ncbi:MAG: nickel pincer cofactor biosynthesis protein LarB [Lachnospiraceae bacterium]|nr:nickel pincer cofactor biosynthesis protein LarB [Lachnospiraceae bacterium]
MNYSDEDILKLRKEPYVDLGFAKVDTHRRLRQGVSEVIYGAGKTKEQILEIANTLVKSGDETILITRINEDTKDYVVHGLNIEHVLYDIQSGACVLGELPKTSGHGTIVVATGGTSDIPVAEEAAITAMALGNDVKRLYDVGVAGIHRLFHYLDDLMTASVIIAVAGMEGALASVIGGLVSCPVIAVPTSVGYGANFQGLSALLSMLNSCASGVSVVNIDNGFGAGYQASLINHV